MAAGLGEKRKRRRAGSRCAATSHGEDEKRIWQSDSISSFSPSLAPLRALNMCLEREFPKQGCRSEGRLCATLTDLCGSSLRSLMRRGVVRVKKKKEVSPPSCDLASYLRCSVNTAMLSRFKGGDTACRSRWRKKKHICTLEFKVNESPNQNI